MADNAVKQITYGKWWRGLKMPHYSVMALMQVPHAITLIFCASLMDIIAFLVEVGSHCTRIVVHDQSFQGLCNCIHNRNLKHSGPEQRPKVVES
ncbi:unnamed protein product [Sphenostylis stenocarpa]|uniref:Uncharacterized protein n=1 Tax=Sphenostylis stenocarpa TaxID=92480 RepID=A0AA86SJL2_9FABA|nr:unnamed protein product [Sphenostylis stenocarpa]